MTTLFTATILKNPQRVGWELDVTRFMPERRRGVGAHAQRVFAEHELPALADIHLRLERHRHAVPAGLAAETHLFQANDAGDLLPDRGATARAAFEPRAHP